MSAARRVLFATSEAYPLIKTGGLADVSGALPAALRSLGVDARILLPGYPQVLGKLPLRLAAREVPLLPGLEPARLLRGRMPDGETPLYVLDAPSLYRREGGPYQDADGVDWDDNWRRFGALSRMAALLGMPEAGPVRWSARLVHCNDWQTGLAPAYLAHADGPRARSLASVHNMSFTGSFDHALLPALGLPWESYSMHGLEFHGHVSYLKAALYYADHVATVSPTYAREIQTPDYGAGLDGLLRHRSESVTGILNGIDTGQWDPAADPNLAVRYDAEDLDGKRACRTQLQERLGLQVRNDTILLGMVSRITYQKGSDLVLDALRLLADRPVQFAILGSGDRATELALEQAAAAAPGQVSFTRGYDEPLAHQIEAGADAFLMPSRFEPCGLNQMYSMRYGTPPIVRRTGGLADSVVDATDETIRDGTATGFVFDESTANALADTVERARTLRADVRRWRALQRNGMRRDFSWRASAEAYLDLYDRLLSG